MILDAYLAALGVLLAVATVVVLVALVTAIGQRIHDSAPALRARARHSRRGAKAQVADGLNLGGW